MEWPIDLRSDTVTTPTPDMRSAMAKAAVGDDVLGEDPTTRLLEEKAAEILGKEAALFTASGTMSNQIAVMCLTKPGDEIIASSTSHIFNLEVGGLAALSGVQVRPLGAPSGIYPLDELEASFREASIQSSPTTLVCFENSADLNLGLTVSAEDFDSRVQVCKKRGVAVYLDGARLFNTAVALKETPARLAQGSEAVAVCLSKGLAAPVGSILAGSRDFVNEARRIRQRLGGGWRQAGVIAAAGIVALDSMIERLAADHDLAGRLAGGLVEMGLEVKPFPVQTNILQLDCGGLKVNSRVLATILRERGVLVKPVSPEAVRMVTHKDVDEAGVGRVLEVLREVIKRGSPTE